MPVFISGCTGDHHVLEMFLLCSSIQNYNRITYEEKRFIIYDLGGCFDTDEKMNELRDNCPSWVEYRTFNYSPYPSYVRDIVQFRWKPLIIAESLIEFPAIWWIDSSTQFTNQSLEVSRIEETELGAINVCSQFSQRYVMLIVIWNFPYSPAPVIRYMRRRIRACTTICRCIEIVLWGREWWMPELRSTIRRGKSILNNSSVSSYILYWPFTLNKFNTRRDYSVTETNYIHKPYAGTFAQRILGS